MKTILQTFLLLAVSLTLTQACQTETQELFPISKDIPKSKTTLPENWPPIEAYTPRKATDGLPIHAYDSPIVKTTGDVQWIMGKDQTMVWPSHEASDGQQIYFALRNDKQQYSDILIRGKHIYHDVLASLSGQETHPGGCAVARKGVILLTAPANDKKTQNIWIIQADGSMQQMHAPRNVGSNPKCHGWLTDDGRFTLAMFGFVSWDGKEFTKNRDWFSGRTIMGTAFGKKYCFRSCNKTEKASNPPEVEQLKKKIGCTAHWIAYKDRLAGICSKERKVLRWQEGKEAEILADIPQTKTRFSQKLAFTENADLIIQLDYHYRKYVIWKADSSTLSKAREKSPGEMIANTSPSLLITGGASVLPKSEVGGILLGKDIGHGAGGSTFGYSKLDRSAAAYAAQIERAQMVLSAESVWVANEAIVDSKCGRYIRSPMGWEGMKMHDWQPPKLPQLHSKSLSVQNHCLNLKKLSVLPSNPSLMLAIDNDETLWGAWLPYPLPLPKGISFRREKETQKVSQNPLPGLGWTELGKATSVDGINAVKDKGKNISFPKGSWKSGGGMEITIKETSIILGRYSAETLPPKTKPMAMNPYGPGLWGSIGKKLVVCKNGCRVLDPGVDAEIVAVVPRTKSKILLGYQDGKVGVYDVPPSGGVAIKRHPITEKLEQMLTTAPTTDQQ